MSSHPTAIPGDLIADGSQEIELGMIGIPADHAVGIGQLIEEAADLVILPSEGSIQAFHIHPDHGTLMAIVKMGVLHGAGSDHQAVSAGTPKGVILFLDAAFHGPKGIILLGSSIGIIAEFSGS